MPKLVEASRSVVKTPDHDAPVPAQKEPAVVATAVLGEHDAELCGDKTGCLCFCASCYSVTKPGCVCENCGCDKTQS